MKLPKKNIPLALAVLSAAFFASATALARPESSASALAALPGYMVQSANLGNSGYLDCIKKKVQAPVDVKVVTNFGIALECQANLKL
jgi:hypothetical protein